MGSAARPGAALAAEQAGGWGVLAAAANAVAAGEDWVPAARAARELQGTVVAAVLGRVMLRTEAWVDATARWERLVGG
jgi:hypothetical protein